eukprot:c15542_g1_i2.p1 GENE.c15542_g1_i2~~c15542_g1_i2.p1  ORF type:complete len:1088 (+),score=210.96 c15542_g1_i2:44-3307(+)
MEAVDEVRDDSDFEENQESKPSSGRGMGQTSQTQGRPARSNSRGRKQSTSEMVDLLSASQDWPTIPISSDSDVVKHCGKLRDELKKENDWEKRSASLVRLGSIAKGVQASGVGRQAFQTQLKAMRRELSDNVLDLRSSVVREAAICIMLCAWATGMDFELIFDAVLESLLKQIIVSIAVIKDSTHECLLECLRATPTPRVLDKLIESAHSRSVMQRLRTSEYFVTIMKFWPQGTLERVMPKLTDVLKKKVLADADSQVKLNGRLCVKEMMTRMPNEAADFIESLDQSTRRLLQDVLGGAVAATSSVPNIKSGRMSAGTSNDQSVAARAAQRSLSSTNNLSPAVATALGRSKYVLGENQGDVAVNDAPTSSRSQGPRLASSRSTSSGSKEVVTSRLVPIAEQRNKSDQSTTRRGFGFHSAHVQSDPVLPNSHSASPPRMPRTASKPTPGKYLGDSGLVTASASTESSSLYNSGSSSTAPSNNSTTQSSRARLPLKDTGSSNGGMPRMDSSESEGSNNNNRENTLHREEPPSSKYTKSTVRTPMRIARAVNEERAPTPEPEHAKEPAMDMSTALSIVESDTPWKDKEAALNFIVQESDSTIRRFSSRVNAAVLQSLVYSHFKVQSAAIKCFTTLLKRRHSDIFLPNFADIFAVLLSLSVVGNATFRKDGETSVHTTLQLCSARDSVPALTSTLRRAVLDHNEPVAVAGLEQLNYALTLEHCALELTTDIQLSVVLPVLAACVSQTQRNADMKALASESLALLRSTNERAMAVMIRSCSSEIKSSLMTCPPVADMIPALTPPSKSLETSSGHSTTHASNVPPPTVLGRSGSNLKSENRPLTSARSGTATTPTTTDSSRGAKKDDLQDLVKEVVAKAKGSRDMRQQALRKMFQWTKDDRVVPIVWGGDNVRVLSLSLLDMFSPVPGDPDHEFIRDHAIAVFESLLENHPDALPIDFHRPLLLRLLEAHNDSMREAANTCLVRLLGVIDPYACLEELIPIIDAEEGPVLQASIFSLRTILPRFDANEILDILPRFLPGVLKAFRSKSADVRKAVVDCLVKLHGVIGDTLMEHLTDLNPTQLRLVQVYIERQS